MENTFAGAAKRFVFVGFVVLVFLTTAVRLGNGHSLKESNKSDVRSCLCKSCSENIVDVECINKLSAREIQSILNRTDPSGDLFELHLRISSPAVYIPANVLSGRRFSRIFIYCSNGTPFTKLTIDPNAFRTSSHQTDTFRIFNCDMSQQTNFAFLTDFVKLTRLSIKNCSNIVSFEKLPLLNSLKVLTVFNCSGLEKMEKFPIRAIPTGLKELDLALNSLNDEKMGQFLDSAASSFSARTLEILRLSGNRLTRIPDNKIMFSFTSLGQLFFDGNVMPSIGSLEFCSRMPNLTVLSLMDMTLTSIQPNTFTHVRAKVHLDVNNLTRFESSVYKKFLERSVESGSGGLTFTSNLVDCNDCGLAWLIRDNRRLIDYVQGTCYSNSSSIKFEEVEIGELSDCEDTVDDENKSSWLYFLLLKLVRVGF